MSATSKSQIRGLSVLVCTYMALCGSLALGGPLSQGFAQRSSFDTPRRAGADDFILIATSETDPDFWDLILERCSQPDLPLRELTEHCRPLSEKCNVSNPRCLELRKLIEETFARKGLIQSGPPSTLCVGACSNPTRK